MRWDYTQGNSGQESPIPIIDSAAQVWLLEPTFATMKDPSNVSEGLTPAKHKDKQDNTRKCKQGRFILPVGDRAHLMASLVVSCVAILRLVRIYCVLVTQVPRASLAWQ